MVLTALRQTIAHMETVNVVNKDVSAPPCSSALHHVSTTKCLVSLLQVSSHSCDGLIARSLIARRLIPQL